MSKVISFKSDVSHIKLPDKFDYPFHYEPHSISKIATKELQEYLKRQTDFTHNFGFSNSDKSNGLGKMFGVLVVRNNKDELGYLAAFSGKLGNSTQHKLFVPPVFDVLNENGFYKKAETTLNLLNSKIQQLITSPNYLEIKEAYNKYSLQQQAILDEEHKKIKLRRKLRRQQQNTNNQLNINEEFYLKEYKIYLEDKIAPLKKQFENFENRINALQIERKEKSAWVQQEIFKHYSFLNAEGNYRNLLSIFNDSKHHIPAGAGDCCAPRLLQYAFFNNLTPVCMAEFWWGKPLNTSIRKHGYFYPACSGKCKPILTYMLEGTPVNDNPLLKSLQTNKKIEIIYEDDDLLIINKPADFLSVPGKEIQDSVYSRIRKLYPTATGPLLVHRIDMATSGALLAAKNKKTHKALQQQFLNKSVQKRYIALLDGSLNATKGTINLPLRVDLEDRPKQLVCNKYGKNAFTKWETITVHNNQTKVYFYPITGRTHQLRIHAAHQLGLNTPIVGDDLYGKKAARLYLHAEKISFIHPTSQKWVEFSIPCPF
ncbi:RluA family pseudouridine synthase [Tenacibaculum maritimum]|uniref:Pseudouridine synthase n=1 Tax=Tenacibaculum maritimum NCIMB 2154 TaxID=1349785 RepID=A0A2H1E8P7_9FLAO|nr:RluA family pseudouridine synthase [Tenacibaculum maritimum]SFZ81871.1 Pseudouridine synthase [Tenacibaculum maritimum NCIMB 2154]